jgi:hypothetical protein
MHQLGALDNVNKIASMAAHSDGEAFNFLLGSARRASQELM